MHIFFFNVEKITGKTFIESNLFTVEHAPTFKYFSYLSGTFHQDGDLTYVHMWGNAKCI